MYLAHYGLSEPPFSITPDPRFVFLSDRHRDALAHLVYGISQGGGGGFVQLTGEVGTGKTTLSRLLLEQLPEGTRVALLLNPRLQPLELLEAICEELGVPVGEARGSGKALVDALNRHLLAEHAAGRTVVVILDEAQELSVPALEQVRLLTNLETATQKLLQIILLGQPELRDLLARPELRQLAQRITARYHLTPLDEAETAAYVRHRLAVAGLRRSPFSDAALRALHRRAGGVPRLLNVIAERALLAGYGADRGRIGARDVHAAADEVLARPPRWRLAGWMALLAVASALGAALWWQAARAPLAEAPPGDGLANPAADALGPVLATGRAQAAAAALLARWQAPERLAGAVLGTCPFRLEGDLHCVRSRGTLAQLDGLDRPVLLSVPTATGATPLALLALAGEQVVIDAGLGPVTLARQSLADAWPGEYLALMRLPGAVRSQPGGTLPAWGAAALDRFEDARDFAPAGPDQRLRRLQASYGLRADGVLGPDTWWALSAWLEGGPRLREPSPDASGDDSTGTGDPAATHAR
ncbi:MAG: AAA family ATPase [Xanthomonadales bacterium]|nr:AAA family ATPase [Xanthomonadales bacterium]